MSEERQELNNDVNLGDILWEYAEYVPPPPPPVETVTLPQGETVEPEPVMSAPQPVTTPPVKEEGAGPDPQTEPEKPEASDESQKAEEPEQPEPSKEPQEPKQPEGPKEPEQPESPKEPEQPQKTEQPKEPEEPKKPEQPQRPEPPKKAPKENGTEKKFPFQFPKGERKKREPEPPPTDFSPNRLASECRQELAGMGQRCIISMVLSGLLLLLALPEAGILPVLDSYADSSFLLPGSMLLFLVVAAVCQDVLKRGFGKLVSQTPDGDSLALLATAATVLDCATVYLIRVETLPFCAPCALVLSFHLLGRWCNLTNMLKTCETAMEVPTPYLVTQDPALHAGQTGFRKWGGTPKGLGRQLQTPSRGEVRFQKLTPVLIVACCILPVITTLLHHQPRLVFWSLSALFTAAATLGCSLSFHMPFKILSKRLSSIGAGIAGWPGVVAEKGGSHILLSDYDLYPPGCVTALKVVSIGKMPPIQFLSYAASAVRASASGLGYLFERLMRQEKGSYYPVESVALQEGGIVAQVQGQQVLVGNGEFIGRNGVELPKGVALRDAVLCAVAGEAMGVIILKYTLHSAVLPALQALFHHHMTPILATRDFNLTPHRLRVRGRLPVEQTVFPNLARRVQLTTPTRKHNQTLVAVLCREGAAPYTYSILGARRLRRAARWNGFFVILGACIEVFLTALLSSAGALHAMCAWNLAVSLLLWVLPLWILSLWANRY